MGGKFLQLIVPSYACERPLVAWKFDPVEIGRRRHNAGSEFVEVVGTTYQQKAHTSGYISGVRGFAYNGYGVTGGGGGQIWTSHENVVSCVLRNQSGVETLMEFPSSLAVRNTAVIRLDLIDQVVVAVRNISGRGSPILLADESSFYPLSRLKKTYLALGFVDKGYPEFD
jgi:hypothetical protein